MQNSNIYYIWNGHILIIHLGSPLLQAKYSTVRSLRWLTCFSPLEQKKKVKRVPIRIPPGNNLMTKMRKLKRHPLTSKMMRMMNLIEMIQKRELIWVKMIISNLLLAIRQSVPEIPLSQRQTQISIDPIGTKSMRMMKLLNYKMYS